MRFVDPREEQEDVKIELTPLIDVMFMLVLFFLVTTTFSSAPGFKVNLPQSSAKDIIRDKKDVTIVIGSDNSYAINQQPVSRSQLMDRLREEAQTDGSRLVIIRADQKVSHGSVVEVMDFAKRAGLHRLAIATDPTETPDEK